MLINNKEYLALWKGTTRDEISKTGRLIHEIRHAAESRFFIRQAGLELAWPTLPEWYRELAMTLLCIKISGGSLDKALDYITDNTEGTAE